jgi:hypothetical protein
MQVETQDGAFLPIRIQTHIPQKASTRLTTHETQPTTQNPQPTTHNPHTHKQKEKQGSKPPGQSKETPPALATPLAFSRM